MTRVLVLGRNGQLARALARATPPEGWKLDFAGRNRADLRQLDRVRDLIAATRPDVVINTAAYTAVDRAETEPELAYAMNAEAAQAVAEAARRANARLLHVSTDYVFGAGPGAPYGEDAPMAPLQVYGASKAEGERRVLAAHPDAVIVRTAWLMSELSGFVQTVTRLAWRGEPLEVVNDQLGSPTHVDDLAAALLSVTRERLEGGGEPGVLHVAGPSPATWHTLAEALVAGLDQGKAKLSRPLPLSSAKYGAAAPRPANSVLRVDRLKSLYGLTLRPWTEWAAETAQLGLSAASIGVEKRQQSDG